MTENYYFFNPEYFPVNSVLSFGLRRWSDSWKWTTRVGLLDVDRGGRQRTAIAVVEPDQAILRHRALGEVVKGI